MGQFDGELDAVLAQLKSEGLSFEPGSEFSEMIGDLISLLGTKGPLPTLGLSISFIQKIRKLAGASYTSNLIYVADAVRDELKRLYQQNDALRGRIESLENNPRFAEAMSALALQAMRTSVRERLKRLARIIVNGVKYDDLGSESLDDMLRAATELTDRDIIVLKTVNEQQHKVTNYRLDSADGTINFPREVWQVLEQEKFITPSNQMEVRSSLARLQAVGFGAEIQTMESSWHPRFLVSPQGEQFLNYLEEIESD